MKLSEQVCTLEQAKKIYALGVERRSLFYHFHGRIEHEAFGSEYYSAFTVAELGVMLPHPSSLNEMGGWLHNSECDTTSTDGLPWYLLWEYDLDKENAGFGRHIVSGVTEAEARAAMLIYLLENNLVTPAEINQRLTQK
jgi:hypothetical protein